MKTSNPGGWWLATAALAVGLGMAARAEKTSLKTEAAYVPKPAGTLTFNKDIAPVVFNNCTTCHRAGEVAPFTLMNYTDVKKKAKTIVSVTGKKFMPPWKAEAGFNEFHDAKVLTPEQIGMVKQWYDEGMKEGNASDLPPLPKFTEGWTLGEPDAIFEPGVDYELAAEGQDVFRCFVIPAPYKEDRYVSAMEVRPGNRSIVHHVIAYLDISGKAREIDAKTPEPGYTSFGGVGFPPAGSLGGWAPGNLPRFLPDGVGTLFPGKADIVLQVHYHKSGKVEKDRTRIGVYFSKTPVDKIQRIAPVAYRKLAIPAGDANYMVQTSMPIPADITVLQILPHMHLLGKEMTVAASLPDGSHKPLVRIPNWDYNWQTTYRFKEAVKLAAGSTVSMTARFDNSDQNPNNPSHPPKMVKRGEETTDEMCMAFLYYTVDSEHVLKGVIAKGAPNRF